VPLPPVRPSRYLIISGRSSDHGPAADRALLRWSERRAREIAADHPPNGKRWLQSTWTDVGPSRWYLLEPADSRPVTNFADTRRPDLSDIPEAAVPAGLEVRPVVPERDRTGWGADVQASRDHCGPTPERPA
jgi:hypothetical protein